VPRKVRESGKWIADKKQQPKKANEWICESREGRIIECKLLDLNDFARRVVIGEWDSKTISFTGDLRKDRSENSLIESGIITSSFA
jgi:hypothetical protein